MITRKIKRKFTSATGNSMSYTLTSNNTCVQISPSSGTVISGETIEFEFQFSTVNCFSTIFTLTVTDSDCETPTTETFTLPSPCSSLDGTISFTPDARSPYKFTISPVGGTADYTYQWAFDENLFTSTRGTTNSTLTVRLEQSSVPTFTEVFCTITDASGCQTTISYVHTFCKPVIQTETVQLQCVADFGTGFNMSGTLSLSDISSCTEIVDWSTLEFNNDESQILISNNAGFLTISGKSTSSSTTTLITGTVQNSIGVEATFEFNVVRTSCDEIKIPKIIPGNEVLTSDDGNGDVKLIPIQTIVPEGQDLDYDSFTFVAATGQTLVSATELTGVNGTAEYNCGERELKYTIGTKTENVELIQMQYETEAGQKTNLAKFYIDFENYTGPTASNDTLTLAAGETKTINLAANDSGDIDKSSYQILTFPSEAKLINNNDGTVDVIASATAEGSDSFTYKFTSTNGIESGNGTVNLTFQRAGGYTGQNQICPTTIDLTSFLSGDVTSGGTWAADANNPNSPSISSPTSVDFSSANAGNYKFTYTIGDSEQDVDLILPNYGVTITNTPVVFTVGAASPYTIISFQTIGVDNINNISIEVDFNTGTNTDTYTPDSWSVERGAGTVQVALDQGTGDYDITVTATDVCGTDQTDTVDTISI